VTRLLEVAGSAPTRIVSATIWLADIATFNEMNAVWDAWVPAGHAPARATVEAKLAGAEYAVEIGIVAALLPDTPPALDPIRRLG
jgi:enamine deaminase RidA (YjgF/YER057c/UK114 family)